MSFIIVDVETDGPIPAEYSTLEAASCTTSFPLASPGFVVSGKGNPESPNSASHGAGRVMSRTQATKTFEWKKDRI